jgi:hypothetical protein
MIAREAGDWEKTSHLGEQLNLSLAFIAEASNAAMRWAGQVTGGARGDRP